MPSLFSHDEVSKLLALASSAAAGRTLAERLHEAYAGLRRLLPHVGGNVFAIDLARGSGDVLYVEGLESRDIQDYIGYYRHHDPMARFIVEAPGRVVTLSDAASPRQVDRTEFSDLLGRRLRLAAIAGWSRAIDRGRFVAIALHRARGMSDFNERERALIGLVMPVITACAREHLHAPGPLERLTSAERRVVALLARGLRDRSIAAELGVGFATVRTHVQRAFTKLRVSNRTELLHVLGELRRPLVLE